MSRSIVTMKAALVESDHPMKIIMDSIESKVSASAASANRAGKPLLILVGENHQDPNAVILSAAVMRAANEHGVHEYGIEATPVMVAASEIMPLKNRSLTTFFHIPMARAFDMNVTPLDKPDEDVSKGITVDSIKSREQFMIQKLMEIKGGVLVQVGSNHLEKLATDQGLSNKFHMLVMNTDDGQLEGGPGNDLRGLESRRAEFAHNPLHAKQLRIGKNVIESYGAQNPTPLVKEIIGVVRFNRLEAALNRIPSRIPIQPTPMGNEMVRPLGTSQPASRGNVKERD